jgi:3-hydroxyacyl-[acyl-carrier-protein] dehydratase
VLYCTFIAGDFCLKKGVFLSAFSFVDEVTELNGNQSITALYRLKADAEFLKDHFENFPVMPGVLLLETLKQTAAKLLGSPGSTENSPVRLVEAQGVKFGQFVKPGSVLQTTARLVKQDQKRYFFEGRIDLVDSPGAGKVLSAAVTLEALEQRSTRL